MSAWIAQVTVLPLTLQVPLVARVPTTSSWLSSLSVTTIWLAVVLLVITEIE